MDTILSVITGGATGILGTIGSGIMGYFNRRQSHRHEVELRKLDSELAIKEAEMSLQSNSVAAEAKAMAASYKAASTSWTKGRELSKAQGWVLVAVDGVRGLTRPTLTFGLVAAAFVISREVLAIDVIDSLLYMATTSVTWWFGARSLPPTTKGS